MKFFSKFRLFAALAIALMLARTGVEAQGFGNFGLGVTSSADSLLVSNSLTYTITVSNLVGDLPDVLVSNTLPASVQYVSAIPGQGVLVTNYGSIVVFDITGFLANQIAQMSLTVRPTATGFITNTVLVFAPNNSIVTNTVTTNVVTQVTNTIPPTADLGVAITVPTTAVITNDLIAYGVSVTNAGPNAAPGVILTNTLPSGVIFLKGSFAVVSNNVILPLGTLNSGAFTNIQFTIQPTNAGILFFSAAVGSAGIIDTNTANNTASNSLPVTNYLSGPLSVVTNSAQVINVQNGLIEQSIVVSNVGPNAVTAVRVVVTGLTNRLANAVGTNSGSPFVVYTAPLATPLAVSQSVMLLLQYAPRINFPFTNSQLQAFAVPVPGLTPPVATTSGTNLTITRIVMLTNGLPLIEFPSTLGRIYTIVYSDNMLFSNAMIAPPSIVAPANVVHWIDYGPPTTVSVPSGAGSRFYRVYLNP